MISGDFIAKARTCPRDIMNSFNENTLLLLCAQKDLSETSRERIEHLLGGPVQWQQVTDRAVSEKIAPLVYHTLKQFKDSGRVPDDILRALQQDYYGTVARNMHLFTELGRVLEAFQHNHVDVMVLKGAALANTAYGDIGLRSMADIDILVKEKDLKQSKEIMSSLDYEMNLDAPEQWYRKHHFHLPPFFHREKSIGVEVHWNIANKSYAVDIEEWWDRAVTMELRSTRTLIPAPEDMLLHFCLHLHYQMYRAEILKRGICDFSEIMRYYEGTIQWDIFHREASMCGLSKTADSLLYLVNKFYAPERAALPTVSADDTEMRFAHMLEDRLVTSTDFPGPFIRYYAADGVWNRAVTLLRVLFPEREVMGNKYSVPLTSHKIYLYYCMRPAELLFKYWGDVRMLIFGKKAVRG